VDLFDGFWFSGRFVFGDGSSSSSSSSTSVHRNDEEKVYIDGEDEIRVFVVAKAGWRMWSLQPGCIAPTKELPLFCVLGTWWWHSTCCNPL